MILFADLYVYCMQTVCTYSKNFVYLDKRTEQFQ